jgi:hypothetical protein
MTSYRCSECGELGHNARTCPDRGASIVGQRFGRLTVVAFEGRDEHRRRTWLCVCDCGLEKIARGENLINGTTSSCGCTRRPHNAMTRGQRRREVVIQSLGAPTIEEHW